MPNDGLYEFALSVLGFLIYLVFTIEGRQGRIGCFNSNRTLSFWKKNKFFLLHSRA
jgi:hypothetical protein